MKKFIISFVATLIVMTGVYLISFYLKHGFSFISIILGIVGFFVVYPAIQRWEKILGGDDAKSK